MGKISYKKLKGSQNLRQRLVLALLSSTPVHIEDIHAEETWPGLRPHEVSFIRLLEKVCDDCSVEINDTGTTFTNKHQKLAFLYLAQNLIQRLGFWALFFVCVCGQARTWSSSRGSWWAGGIWCTNALWVGLLVITWSHWLCLVSLPKNPWTLRLKVPLLLLWTFLRFILFFFFGLIFCCFFIGFLVKFNVWNKFWSWVIASLSNYYEFILLLKASITGMVLVQVRNTILQRFHPLR